MTFHKYRNNALLLIALVLVALAAGCDAPAAPTRMVPVATESPTALASAEPASTALPTLSPTATATAAQPIVESTVTKTTEVSPEEAEPMNPNQTNRT